MPKLTNELVNKYQKSDTGKNRFRFIRYGDVEKSEIMMDFEDETEHSLLVDEVDVKSGDRITLFDAGFIEINWVLNLILVQGRSASLGIGEPNSSTRSKTVEWIKDIVENSSIGGFKVEDKTEVDDQSMMSTRELINYYQSKKN